MMTLPELFPEEDFRFHLNLGRGTAAGFFAPTAAHAEILAERRHWLATEPATYAAVLPGGGPLIEEAAGVARSWGTVALPDFAGDALAQCLALGAAIEPDIVLLRPDDAGSFRLVAGALCFPSQWSLAEKAGLPIEAIHDAVPGLNAAIGPAIGRVLQKLRPEAPFFRTNWGLQLGRERNDHPARRLPRIGPETAPADIWMRLEHQALVALPRTGGVLFAIRIAHHALAEFTGDPPLARGLHRALATMPEPMLRYKNLAAVRAPLLRLLETAGGRA